MTTLTVNQTPETKAHPGHPSRDRGDAARLQFGYGLHMRRFTSSHAAAEWIKAERDND
jgi:hypothetical protein